MLTKVSTTPFDEMFLFAVDHDVHAVPVPVVGFYLVSKGVRFFSTRALFRKDLRNPDCPRCARAVAHIRIDQIDQPGHRLGKPANAKVFVQVYQCDPGAVERVGDDPVRIVQLLDLDFEARC
jgi:hypothetical protein